jgi:hypothetical protein
LLGKEFSEGTQFCKVYSPLSGICENSYNAESCPVVLPALFAMSADMTFSSPSLVKAEVFVHSTNGHRSPHVTAWVKDSDGVTDTQSMVPATRDEHAETRRPQPIYLWAMLMARIYGLENTSVVKHIVCEIMGRPPYNYYFHVRPIYKLLF